MTPLEIVRAIYERIRAGDLEGGLELIDPDIEVRDRPEIPDPQVYRGHQGVLDALATSFADFDDVDMVPEEFSESGDEVVVVFRFQGTGRGSGLPVDERIAHVWTVAGGKAVRIQARTEHG